MYWTPLKARAFYPLIIPKEIRFSETNNTDTFNTRRAPPPSPSVKQAFPTPSMGGLIGFVDCLDMYRKMPDLGERQYNSRT